MGDPVVNITFGSGNNPGPTLPAAAPGASTTLTYVSVLGNPANPTPVDGQYTITNNVPYNNAWFSGAPNHTPNDPNGYMAFYNSSEQPGEFYKQLVGNLCGSTTYEFAAWIANVLNPAIIVGVTPDITFRIEQTDGTLLASYDTGPVPQNNVFTWQQYGFYFTTPSAITTVVLRMINNSPGGNANVGNDLAIDDITFRPCGPVTTASFNPINLTDSLALCPAIGFSLYGNTSNGYTNPGYLWQLSNDSGKTWTDIANSNATTMNLTSPMPGVLKNYEYRMLVGQGTNINQVNCRVSSNNTILHVPPLPYGKLTSKDICEGDADSLNFSAATGSPVFSISFTDGNNTFTQNNLSNSSSFVTPYPLTDTTTFILKSVTDASGCSNTSPADSAVTINVNPLPQGGITGGTVCAAATGYVNYAITAGTPSYSLLVTDGIKTDQIDNTQSAGGFNFFGNNSNVYTLLAITDKNGCKRSSNFTSPTAVFNFLPSPKVSFEPVPGICQIDSPFSLQASDTSGLQGSGIFSGNGVTPAGVFNPISVNPGTYPIQYTFTATNGCTDSSVQNITVNPVPTANAGPDIIGCSSTAIQLNATGGVLYSWSPPDGLSNTSIPNPVATVDQTTSYIVTVTNAEGCSSYDSITIAISPLGKAAYKVPNAFTPNGDGKNDCFGIERWGGIDLQEFSIYNRWGQRMFFTKNPSECWDGTFKGIPQDTGGFVYIIRANTPCGFINLKGTVMLLR